MTKPIAKLIAPAIGIQIEIFKQLDLIKEPVE